MKKSVCKIMFNLEVWHNDFALYQRFENDFEDKKTTKTSWFAQD